MLSVPRACLRQGERCNHRTGERAGEKEVRRHLRMTRRHRCHVLAPISLIRHLQVHWKWRNFAGVMRNDSVIRNKQKKKRKWKRSTKKQSVATAASSQRMASGAKYSAALKRPERNWCAWRSNCTMRTEAGT